MTVGGVEESNHRQAGDTDSKWILHSLFTCYGNSTALQLRLLHKHGSYLSSPPTPLCQAVPASWAQLNVLRPDTTASLSLSEGVCLSHLSMKPSDWRTHWLKAKIPQWRRNCKKWEYKKKTDLGTCTDTFSFIAVYLVFISSSSLPAAQRVIFIIFPFPYFHLLFSFFADKKTPLHAMTKSFFFHIYHERRQNNQWTALEEIRRHLCRNRQSQVKESESGMNLFFLCLIPHIACLQACEADFHESTAVNTALKQTACNYDKSVFTISASLFHWNNFTSSKTRVTNTAWEAGSSCETNAVSQMSRSLRVSDQFLLFFCSVWSSECEIYSSLIIFSTHSY